MKTSDRVYVAGHGGMVGSGLLRALARKGFENVVYVPRAEADLRDPAAVRSVLRRLSPDYVFVAAARVGGIKANTERPGEFLYDNLMIEANFVHESLHAGVKKLVLVGSSCIYPRNCPQPMKEDYLMTGPLEPTNEGYAVAKIAGLKLGEYYQRQYGLDCINPMPCNLYGPNDEFDLGRSHVLAALVRRFSDAAEAGAKQVTVWGSGTPRREFMHVDDASDALIFLAQHHEGASPINVGWGTDVTIRELAEMVADATGFKGEIRWDSSMPDGMPRKCLDVSRLTRMGFSPSIDLGDGIARTVHEYRVLKLEGMIR